MFVSSKHLMLYAELQKRVGGPTKNLLILHILVSIPTKTYMKNTNINFVFHQIHPCERKVTRSGKNE